MTEATEKQINFAKNLGIVSPETFSKEVLKELIQKKIEARDNNKQQAPQVSATIKPIVQEARHDVILEMKEKPHSYEFGKAGARHKIYYAKVEDLKAHIEILKEEGLIEEEPNFE